MSKKKTKIQALSDSLPRGYAVCTRSPGDGVTRYRFFKGAPKNQSYFGPHNGIVTVLGLKAAETFARGLRR